jgi:hypothetical protein
VPDTNAPPCTHSTTPLAWSVSEVDTKRPRTSPKRASRAPFGDRHAWPNASVARRVSRRLSPCGFMRACIFRPPDMRFTRRARSGLGSAGTGLGAKPVCSVMITPPKVDRNSY